MTLFVLWQDSFCHAMEKCLNLDLMDYKDF